MLPPSEELPAIVAGGELRTGSVCTREDSKGKVFSFLKVVGVESMGLESWNIEAESGDCEVGFEIICATEGSRVVVVAAATAAVLGAPSFELVAAGCMEADGSAEGFGGSVIRMSGRGSGWLKLWLLLLLLLLL